MSETYLLSRQMWRRPTTWLAAALWVFILAIAGLLVALHAAGWEGAGNTDSSSGVSLFVALFAFATMGALVAIRVPRNAVGWIFLAIPLGGAVAGITELLAFQGLVHDPGSVPGAIAFAWVYSWCWYPTVGLLGFILLVYPTSSVPGPRWRLVPWALGAALALMTLGYMLKAGHLDGDKRLPDNPLGVSALRTVFSGSDKVAGLSMIGLIIAAIVSVILRFHRSRGDERQQMKWMACATVLLISGFIAQSAFHLNDVAFSVAISTLPLALGVAMFKYRLYDVDRVINKTLVYGVSSALLAGAYIGLVIAGESLFSFVARGSSVAVAISTLVVAGLFLPVRRRVQHFVDRRFYRRKVDVEETLARFAARLRHEADIDTLLAEMYAVVGETMAPSHVQLWLRDPA